MGWTKLYDKYLPTINGNPIVSYINNNCFIQCLSATGNKWLCFRANNTTTD